MSGRGIKPADDDVLIVVDIQNDFCAGGALAVPGGEQAALAANAVSRRFRHVVLSQDWHPPGHLSFASSHPGRAPLEVIDTDYGAQTLWPDHCVQGSAGAEFHRSLDVPHAGLILRKGMDRRIDSYSVFFENDRATATGLAGYLRERGVSRVFLLGLAFDFCVLWSAEDGRRLGFEVVVLEDGCRSIDIEGSAERARAAMIQAGVVLSTTASLI